MGEKKPYILTYACVFVSVGDQPKYTSVKEKKMQVSEPEQSALLINISSTLIYGDLIILNTESHVHKSLREKELS